MLFRVGVLIVLGMMMIASEGRSIGESAGVNFPNQGNYQDYAEQQEYAEQQGEVERSARDVQETGVDSYQPQKEYVREDANANVAGASYQARVNGDDDDLEQQPRNNVQVGMDGRAMVDERGVKKEVDAVGSDVAEQREMAEQQEIAEQRDAADQRDVAESLDVGEQRDVAEQRDDSLLQNSNLDRVEVGRGGDASNFRPPRDNGAIQALQEPARTEMARGDPGEVAFEEPRDQAAGRPMNEATYTGAEQEHSYNNYNYAQEQEGAADGPEQQQQGAAANEENVPPVQYEQAVNEQAVNEQAVNEQAGN